MVYVTHDQVEAMTMADKIVVLRQGRVEQVGSPLALYNAPRNRFVAGFMGSPKMNFIDGVAGAVSGSTIEFTTPGLSPVVLPAAGHGIRSGDALTLGIRAEHIEFGDGWQADVEVTEHYGASSYLHCRLSGGNPILVHEAGQSRARRGDRLSLRLPVERCHVFDASEAVVPAGANPGSGNEHV